MTINIKHLYTHTSWYLAQTARHVNSLLDTDRHSAFQPGDYPMFNMTKDKSKHKNIKEACISEMMSI